MKEKTDRKTVIRGLAVGVACLVVAVVVLWIPECWAQSSSGPVAKVNDTVLTRYDLDDAFNKILPAASFHGGITEQQREKHREEALGQMITDELLYQEALRLGLEVDEKEVEKIRDRTVKNLGSKRRYKSALENSGLTDKEFKEKIRKGMLVNKIREIEIAEKSVISDEEAREYYEENSKGYKRPPSWRIRHILVSVDPSSTEEQWEAMRKRAEEALEKIKAGEDMASVAWDYSDDPYRVKGGDLGLVHSGRLVAELEVAIARLKVGEVSDVIRTIYGFHIARVEEKVESEQLQYEDVEKRIKKQLSEKRYGDLEKELEKRLRGEAKIEVY